MLLNLSNHPSAKWPTIQMDMAESQWGKVQDKPFPNIDPSWDEKQVKVLAAAYLEEILQLQPAAVHLMGELTFSFELIQRLKEAGIPCIASTTARSTQDLPDGTKVSKFEFVRFRQYLP